MKYFKKIGKVIKPNVLFAENILNSIKDKLINKNLGNLEIENILNKSFKKYNINFSNGMGQSGNSLYAENYLIGASIYENGNIEIEYEDNFWTIFEEDLNWKEFIKSIKNLISHELIHRIQFSKIRKLKNNFDFQNIIKKMESDPSKVTKYLSQKHEIMSFANEAVNEFKDENYNDKQIIKLIKNPLNNSSPSAQESNTFWMYTEWFEINDKPFKNFLKYMVGYLI